MKKSDAVAQVESGTKLGRAVGLSKGRISQWPEDLTQKQADLVRGAMIRLGKALPEHMKVAA